jgi:hypothetical protein
MRPYQHTSSRVVQSRVQAFGARTFTNEINKLSEGVQACTRFGGYDVVT